MTFNRYSVPVPFVKQLLGTFELWIPLPEITSVTEDRLTPRRSIKDQGCESRGQAHEKLSSAPSSSDSIYTEHRVPAIHVYSIAWRLVGFRCWLRLFLRWQPFTLGSGHWPHGFLSCQYAMHFIFPVSELWILSLHNC